jgi:hypothetical protein
VALQISGLARPLNVHWKRNLAPETLGAPVEAHFAIQFNAAQAVAVILHELATNAAKYGALSVSEGHAEVTWSYRPDGRLRLEQNGQTLNSGTRVWHPVNTVQALASRY